MDKQADDAEANLDGKFLLRCSDPKLSAEAIALGYKQLLEVASWRDMKSIIAICGRSTTASRIVSTPTCCCAGWRCCSSASPKPRAVSDGPRSCRR